ncbi:hypothetical protein [Dokdonella sp.]|uniref:hypothetical protein n=1 Tax=Dokdonella sp. TaxID=2291710 RepID=UPI0031BDC3D7|nr:hypothetical protein [Dokdonella sp.]
MRPWIPALLALALLGCSATQPVTRNDGSKTPFITETMIEVPEQARTGRLLWFNRAGTAGAGVQARYLVPELPDVPIDLFIYPAGRMPADRALQLGVEAFRASVAYAERQGSYHDAVIRPPAPFAVAWADGTPIPARKLTLEMSDEGGALLSRAWIAYKQNYWFKLRITAPPALAAKLDTQGDVLARDLFSHSQALSKGACGDVTVTIDPDQLESAEAFMEAVLAAGKELERDGCAGNEYPQPTPGSRSLRLPFPPDAWGDAAEAG